MATPGVSMHLGATPMSIATPLRDSMPFTSTKGLLNGPGQNNCFLNSAVQVLWHLDIFRRSFRDLSGHACMADSCIFCALKELFSQLQFSTETALPPDALRRALAESFFDQQRFQLGFMDDAAECFENMLMRIHTHIAHGEAEDMCNARHCIPHQKFAMTLVEQSVCGQCGASSEPLSYTQMVHYVSTSTLVYQVRNPGRPSNDTFGQLLKRAGNMGDVRTCPSACGAVIQIGRSLINHPEIVSVGLVWNSERPTLEHITEVFSTIGTTLRLGDVFHTATDNRWSEVSIHNLVGVVTYYGKHYSTFFFHTKLRVWIYFDDATVREVGPKWEQVVDKCRKGRYQPLLLLYALPDGTPVNTDNAPKQVTPFYNDNKAKKAQAVLRRSITPSPEKPVVGTTRRAITPNPEKPPLPRNEYQNLSVIQKTIFAGADEVDSCAKRSEVEYVTRYPKPVHRTLSNGSSSGMEGMDHMNIPRRRDSGNWSGDRNSASSASSTTMENPYLYLVGKVPHGSIPGSPTRSKSDSGDAGYDSYSLSSNDSSSMSTLQHLMKMGHLAKIPEDYNHSTSPIAQNCDVLCDEADELLVKSRQLEDEHDLVLALALCNAAATKARAAMNAPYNNPQTLTLARMKHNTCIMRARSLHRRMTQTLNPQSKESPPEIRHTREGSSGSGRHSRQNSRDKGQHSRQNSRELLVFDNSTKEKSISTKNIEIYATLPKKKDVLKSKMEEINIGEDLYDKPPNRESRSIFSRSKSKDKVREKRSRSEDRNKTFSIAPEIKDTLKKAKEEKEDKKEKDGKNKKQHKIRRKLLMGGLIKRKNRSMPDLTDVEPAAPTATVDDSGVGLKPGGGASAMSGYLSEGHLEFTGGGGNANPNLERSKLMRKSFHGSAGKMLTAAKVPPPPPLRTTSTLSKAKLAEEMPPEQYYHNFSYAPQSYASEYQNFDPRTYYGNNTVVTKADVHHERSPIKNDYSSSHTDSGVDEVDCVPRHDHPGLDLPPYPTPLGSVVHSRQASEEFPPPPPPLDLSALDECLPPVESAPSTLLAQLQTKRREILTSEPVYKPETKPSGNNLLKELQAKQAALRMKKTLVERNDSFEERVPYEKHHSVKSVKDLASKFEITEALIKPTLSRASSITAQDEIIKVEATKPESIPPKQIAEEILEVEMLSAAVNKTLNLNEEDVRRPRQKKKSVSFCDQVILVATAEDPDDQENYIPNPILERVLRTAMNKPETAAIRQEIITLRENERKKLEAQEDIQVCPEEVSYVQQPLYVRRNSLDNLLSQEKPRRTSEGDQYYHEQAQNAQNGNYHNMVPYGEYNQYNGSPVAPVQQNHYNNHQYGSPQHYGNTAQMCSPPYQNGYRTQPSPQMQSPYQGTPYRQSPYQPVPQNSPAQSPYQPVPQNSPAQSPYQPVPQNSPAYAYYHQQNRQQQGGPQYRPNPEYQQYPTRGVYTPPQAQIRQTTPSPLHHNGYHHAPSPVPSNVVGSNYGYSPSMYRGPANNNYGDQEQRVPMPMSDHGYDVGPYQRVPQYPAERGDVYQRVPEVVEHHQQQRYPVYQHVPKQVLKKTVSFEPGTKGGDVPPPAVVTPIVVNNANNSIPTDKTKCNLCRKKNVVAMNLYCADCEFYMSRFAPKC